MMRQQVGIFSIVLVLHSLVYPYTATQNDITLSVLDYSRRPAAYFLTDVPKNCQVKVSDINSTNKLYPFKFVITNKSEKRYKLTPAQIAGTIRTDYGALSEELIINTDGNWGMFFGLPFVSIGLFGTLGCGGATAVHHFGSPENLDIACNRLQKKSMREHFEKCAIMKKWTLATAGLITIFLLSACYCGSKTHEIHQKRFVWLKKHGLPKEGISIGPGKHIETIVFLTQETYNQSNIMVSLIQPVVEGGATETFNVCLLD